MTRQDPGHRASSGLMLWLVIGLFTGLVLSGCDTGDRQLRLVIPRLDIDREIAEELSRLFDDSELDVVLVENPDPNRPGQHLLATGGADLALVANTAAYDPELATVVPLYQTVLHIAYRSDSPIEEVRDLFVGDRLVFAGPPGSPSRELLETAARRSGIAPEQITYATADSGCVDVLVVYAPVLPDISARNADCGEYRMFSLGRPSDIGAGSSLDSVTLLNPQLKPFVIPQGTYGAMTPEPVVTLAVDKLLVARSDLSETLVYDLLGEILRLKPALSARHPGLFHQLTEDFDISGSVFVLHPGALAYKRRDEPDVYERYSGVAEVVVTLLIGLVSGIYAIVRIYSIRRKNRIDAFCREALEIRDRAADPSDRVTRESAARALKTLKDRAYDMLIDEKLAADESFRIFITLCDDILAELAVD